MKPLSIADYLDHLGRAPAEKAPPRRESSPFRPRSLPGAQSGEPRSRPAIAALAKGASASETQAKDGVRRTPWERMRLPLAPPAAPTPAGGEAVKPEDVVVRLAEAHARGREDGLAEGRAEAQDRHAAELAAARQRAEAERLEFERNEIARLEGAIRCGLKEIEDNVGAAVARILAPFLERRLVERAVDELAKAIARLCAAGSPGLMTIRGPERVLVRLRERIADLPVEVAFVDDNGPEVLAEANATQITTALGPWAELLAPLAD
jgi:flagellar biosynthesis/type III secretory pathway protein FliH